MKNQMSVRLTLEDGSIFHGKSFGAQVAAAGEVVFNTAMTGYPENLTDPTCKGQILCLTYPLVGNYGVPYKHDENDLFSFHESSAIHVTGLLVTDYSPEYSHWDADRSLGDWLLRNNIPGIHGIDTRAIAKKIRDKGTMTGIIEPEGTSARFPDPGKTNLVAQVSTTEVTRFGSGRIKIILVDCGVKNSIIRSLLRKDTTVIKVPWDYDFHEDDHDGIVISNGPGDPKTCAKTINNIARSLPYDKPIFGIGLGHQLLALATGADTVKLKHGHRSHNQPVIAAGSNKVLITSQNHGYAVNNSTLGNDWEATFINLNDNTNEGMKHKTKPFFSLQFHPDNHEDVFNGNSFFDKFIENILMIRD